MFRPMDGAEDGVQPHRKRKRSVISCTECHRRKQKCDRQQPCQRCTRREIPDQCHYESAYVQTMLADDAVNLAAMSASSSFSAATSSLGAVSLPSTASDYLVSKNLGYTAADSGTLGIIHSLGAMTVEPSDGRPGPSGDAAVQCKGLIRQLPPQKHINTLVSFFYRELSWQYDIVDENIFRQQLSSWEKVPYAARNQFFHLPAGMRHFPALLFQLLANALLFQPVQHDGILGDLCHAPDMDLADVAAEFSDAGRQISALFGSDQVSIVKVQAGLLRACFEKTTGSVADAWHTLGQTIRDAQELGLHRLRPSDELSADQGKQARVGRKLWFILHLWDGHMAVVLGRPMSTNLDPESVPSPDCDPNEVDGTSESIPITPFNMILCGYNAAYRYLPDIHRLNSAAPRNVEYTVDDVQSAILQNIKHIPAWARLNPRNQNADYMWLPAARETLHTEVYFALLALHRPLIFQQSHSRTQAFTAATRVLESQSRLFGLTEPRHYPAFSLVFATFDAAVVVAATFIVFPQENKEQLHSSLRLLQWALERLFVINRQNRLARTAYGVLKTMYDSVVNTTEAALQQNEPPEEDLAGGLEHNLSCEMNSIDMQQMLAALPEFDRVIPPQMLSDLVFPDSTADMLPAEVTVSSSEHLSGQAVTDDEFWQSIDGFG